jgi:hypothetical protein
MMCGPGASMRHYTPKNFWQPLSRLSHPTWPARTRGGVRARRPSGLGCDFRIRGYVI